MVYVMLAEGFEEIEALTVVDLLRRAEIDVKTVALSGEPVVKGAHGISVCADIPFAEADLAEAEMVVLPGGMPGTTNLDQDSRLGDALLQRHGQEHLIAAICAAPMVLGHLGILKGRRATIYRGMEAELEGAAHVDEPVVSDGHITTSQGPGTAMEFALQLIRILKGAAVSDEVRDGILYRY